MNLLCRVLYSAEHHPVVYLANIQNTALCIYFLNQYDDHYGYLIFVALVTVVCYGLHPHAQGISTLWSFCFGFQRERSLQDTLMYGIPCLSLILFPLPEICKWLEPTFGINLWPWTKEYQSIAVTAHSVFAALGFAMREILDALG